MMERMWLVRRSVGTAVTTSLMGVVAGGILLSGLATPAGAVSPSADPTDSATPTASASASATPSASASATPSPTSSATSSPTPTDSASPSSTPSTPAATDAPSAPATTPVALPAALGSWCNVLMPSHSITAEKKAAWDLMAGKAKASEGGTYLLSEHPDWKPQSQTDTSGDRHANSLNWALPLLYRGVRVQNAAMIDRFRNLITYWVKDHQGKRAYWVDGSIYGGLRTQTLVCAAQTLGDPVIGQAAMRDARTMAARNWGAVHVASGANNTDLIRQTGALAAFCWAGDIAMRDRVWSSILSVSRGLVHDDGSDVEGSPGYAIYTEHLLRIAADTARACGLDPAELDTLRGNMYDFIAQAVAPDFYISSIGDTVDMPLRSTFGLGDARADWVRSQGKAGTPPAPIYSSYKGGYAFGRAGWQPQPGMPDTFYSLRFSNDRASTPHTHDDGTSIALFSKGTWWLDDPGPYRYENSSPLRVYVKSRAAHGAIMVGHVTRTRSRGVREVASHSEWQTGGNDTTCVRDLTWSEVVVTRCTQYIRSVDAFVVTDHVLAGPGRKGRNVSERWMIAPKLSASNASDVITLASKDKRMDVVKSGAGGWNVRVAGKGSSAGWFTGVWGEKVPGAVLSRTIKLPRSGLNDTLVTVFIPRNDGESVPVTIADGATTITRGGQTIVTPLPTP
ncbi:MAG: hypothetical protein RL205_63 [Actinomycetota bacterium]